MLRTILVPVENDINGKTAIEHLWTVAPLFQSRAYGLHMIDIHTLEEGVEETSEARRLFEHEAQQNLSAFEEGCQSHGIRSKNESVIGDPLEEIAMAVPKADLLIIGEVLSVPGSVYEIRKTYVRDILHRVSRPVLIARGGHEQLKRIVVGYDGSEKGAHALQWGADLAERAKSTMTVVISTDRKEYGAKMVDDINWYLEAYDLTWHPVLFEGTPNEALSKIVREEKADLVIVGSHGHGRLHELAFGSTTNHVLEYVQSSILIYR